MGRSQPRARMRALFDHGFVAMPTPSKLHHVPLGETVYWLGKEGAAVVAALQGRTTQQLAWRRQPRYARVAHDLAINNLRMAVLQAVQETAGFQLQTWIPESEFATNPDKVTYKSRTGIKRHHAIRPDGFFVLIRQENERQQTFAFLLEIDMGTEDNPRFAREKVRPGSAYLGSWAYRQRFGLRYGRILVVTTSTRRLQNLKAQTERAGGQGRFLFSTFDAISSATILRKPIWTMAGEARQRCLLP